MVDFSAIIENLVEIGFYSVILPFILVYAVVFAILEKAGIFNAKPGESNKQTKNINSVIAFVFGLFAVAATQTVMWMQSFITSMVTFIIFILVVLILLGFILGDGYMKLLHKDNDLSKPFKAGLVYTIAAIVILVALIALMLITGTWDWFTNWLDDNFVDNDTIITVLILAAIGFVIYWITKEDKPAKADSK